MPVAKPRFGFLVLGAWLALTLFVLNTLAAPPAWHDWPDDYCRRVNCYCEPLYLDRLIAQPSATYSNLSFIGIGLGILWLTLHKPPSLNNNPFTQSRAYPIMYASALTTTGFFSFFYHASLTKVGDYVDLMGMYIFVGFLLLYNLNRLHSLNSRLFALLYISLIFTLAIGLYVAYGLQQVYLAALIVATIAIEIYVRLAQKQIIDLRLLITALAIFIIGATVWMLDSNGSLPCWPTAPLTWHALWHLSAATAAGMMYLFYRSERTV